MATARVIDAKRCVLLFMKDSWWLAPPQKARRLQPIRRGVPIGFIARHWHSRRMPRPTPSSTALAFASSVIGTPWR
jgi:hypothetical protein